MFTRAKNASIDQFVEQFPAPIQALTAEARLWFRAALPEAVERLYQGWELIGYRIPAGRGTRYVGFVAPKRERVAVGFEQGIYLVDRFPFLTGNGRQVRELVLVPGEGLPPSAVIRELIIAAGELALASRAERFARS